MDSYFVSGACSSRVLGSCTETEHAVMTKPCVCMHRYGGKSGDMDDKLGKHAGNITSCTRAEHEHGSYLDESYEPERGEEARWSGENINYHTSQSVEHGFCYSSMFISSSTPPSPTLISVFLSAPQRERAVFHPSKSQTCFLSFTFSLFTQTLRLFLFASPALIMPSQPPSALEEERSH